MERIYRLLPSKQKFANTILLASVNSNISEIKTNLVQRQINILAYLKEPVKKVRCWQALNRMLNEIDIPMSETGDQVVQRSPYGIVTYKNELLGKLNSIEKNENNKNIQEYAQQIIQQIQTSETNYKVNNDDIIINDDSYFASSSEINEKAVELFNQPRLALILVRKLNFIQKRLKLTQILL